MRKTRLIATLAACFGATGALAETQVTWWHAMGSHMGDVVNEISTLFNDSQSEYRITPVFKGSFEETLLVTTAAFRAGEPPNIVQVFEAGAATMMGVPGVVVPVETLLEEHGHPFEIDEFLTGVRSFYSDEQGTLVAMPFNSASPLMYFNVNALERAGVTAPKTWEEFETVTGPALRDAGYIALAQSHLPWIFTENFHSRHNLPFATDDNGFGSVSPRMLVNNDALKMHFTRAKAWADEGLFGYYGAGWYDNRTPFEQQEVAMWIGSSGSLGGLKALVEFPLGAAFLPYWEGVAPTPSNTFVGGAALWAMAGHDEAENAATAAFFAFLKQPEIQFLWHKRTGDVPNTYAAYELAKSVGHYETLPEAELAIQQLSLPGGAHSKGYRIGFYLQIRDAMRREYGRIFAGETSVNEAFAIIETEANALIDRFAKSVR